MNFTNTVKKYILLLLLFGYGFREKYNLYKFILGKKNVFELYTLFIYGFSSVILVDTLLHMFPKRLKM